MSKQQKITTGKIVDALGGTRKVAELLQTSDRVVYNWRQNRFPANTYIVIHELLRKHKIDAPDSLWSMRTLEDKKRK